MQELRYLYKSAKKDLRREINRAKAAAWQELVQSVEEDPWGLPYKLVLNKLRTNGPTLTETLDKDILDRTLKTLFPEDTSERERESEVVLDQVDLSTIWDGLEISPQEVQGVISRKKGRNTAPGLDGIQMRVIGVIPDVGIRSRYGPRWSPLLGKEEKLLMD